jgi:hypothetical protein
MMSTTDLNYINTDEEYREICEFLDELSAQDPYMLWEWGRMNFWRSTIHAKKKHGTVSSPGLSCGGAQVDQREEGLK